MLIIAIDIGLRISQPFLEYTDNSTPDGIQVHIE